MDSSLTIANDDLEQLMALLMANNGHWLARIGLFARTHFVFWKFFNLPGLAKRNVVHHYDLKDSLFDQFLDPRRQYSCSYFHTASDTLADALCKMQPDILVTGITLSENQYAYAMQKAKQDQRQHHLAFHLCDYRHQRVSFDRIVSVSMLEHDGMRHFDSYFASIARLFAPNGVVLVHSIGVHHNAKCCNRWLNKYVFPGGYTPSLEQMTLAAGRQGLKILDMEIMRGHYAETLKNGDMPFARILQRFVRIVMNVLSACGNFTLLAGNISFAVRMGWYFNCKWPMITM